MGLKHTVKERGKDQLGDPAHHMAVKQLLAAVGEDPNRAGLEDTPRRFLQAWQDLFWGLRISEDEFLASINRTFAVKHSQMISVKKIHFNSMCEHHLLPFIGEATVAYIPSKDGPGVIGISKLAHIVKYYAARPQVQERLTDQIADALEKLMSPLGIGVSVQAKHLCMAIRGPEVPEAITETTALRGVIANDHAKAEFLSLIRC